MSPPAILENPPKKRRRLSLYRLLEMRIVQVDRRIDQMDRQLADTRQEMREQFARVDAKIDQMDRQLADTRQEMREQFARVDAKFTRVDEKFDRVNAKIDHAASELTARLSWQTNFLGVMIVAMSLMITSAICILGWIMR